MVKNNFRHLPIILIILVFPFLGNAQLPGEKYSAFLNQTVKNHDQFWVRVHAGEALVLNNFTIDAQQIFHTELEILKMVLETNNPKILDSIKNIFKKQGTIDFWDIISKSEKDDILLGIQEIEKGDIVDYEEFMSKHR